MNICYYKLPRPSRILSAVLSTVVLLNIAACSSKLPDALAPGQKVPFTRVTYLEGGYDTLHTYRGKKTALLFWAKWCSKSRDALKDFESLAADLSRAPNAPHFLAVSLDKFQDEEELRRFLDSHGGAHLRHVFSGNGPDDETVQAFRAFEIPVAFAVDDQGVVLATSHSVSDLEDALR